MWFVEVHWKARDTVTVGKHCQSSHNTKHFTASFVTNRLCILCFYPLHHLTPFVPQENSMDCGRGAGLAPSLPATLLCVLLVLLHRWPQLAPPPCPEPSSARLGSPRKRKSTHAREKWPHHTTHTHTLYLNMPNSNSPPAKPLQPWRFLRTSHQSEGSTQAACRAPHPPDSYAVFWNIAMLRMMHIVAYWNAQDVPLTCTQCLVPSGSS